MACVLDIVLVTLGDPGRLTGGYLFHRRMADRAARHGASLRFVSFPDRPFPLATLAAPEVLRRAESGDVLVLDSIVAAFLGPWLALRDPKVPLVAMLHQPAGGIDFGPWRTTIQARLDWMAYRRAALLMVASETLRQGLRAAAVPESRIRLVAPGRDGAIVAAESAGDAVDKGELRQGRRAAVLCVANWLAQKDILAVLEAVARLPDEAVTLHLAGDTEVDPRYAERVRARLAAPELVGRVVAHGRLAPARVAALYAAVDAFVLASHKEPYGTVFGEAMAAGLPVIGWRVGNLPHLATDGREGLLLAPGDIEGLAAALRRVAEDDELRRRLGAAARERALSLPTWDETAATFFEVIAEVAETDGGHGRT
jgi:glycosyltransferase involved in cell wall biosynthesis